MKNLLLFFYILIGTATFAQDSMFVGKVYVLPEVRHPFCIMWEGEWADKEFEIQYAQMFDSVAQFISSNKNVIFELRSHTDSRGSDSLNLKLSQQRADDWLEHLIISGVDSLQLDAIGYGESVPRRVWLVDSLYYINDPNIADLTPIVLNEKYIETFRRKDRKTFGLLNAMNRREELVVISIK